MFDKIPPPPENRAFYEIMWKSTETKDGNTGHALFMLDI